MSLIHWWPLTTDLKDKCGGDDMQCSVASFVAGKIGKCIQIASGDAQVPNPFIGMGNWSIAFWFRDDGSGDWKDFICWSDNKARLEIYKTGGQWIWYSNSTTSGSLFPSGTNINSTIQTNVWYHITIVKEGTKAYFYINGNVDSPKTSTSAVTFTSASATLHFNSRADTSYGAMSLSDVRCYDHALSKKEVQELSRGLVCHYKLNANNNTNLLINSATPSFTGYTAQSSGTIVMDSLLNKKVYECSNTATTEKFIFYSNRFPLVGGETYTFSCDIYCNTYLKGIDVYLLSSSTLDASAISTSYSSDGVKYFAKTPSTGLVPGQWVHISGTLTPNSNQISGYIRIDNNGSTSSGTAAILRVINCKFERGSKESTSGISLGEAEYNSVEIDSSGYSNHGTKYGTLAYSSDSILNGSCTIFPGTAGNYINCGSGGKVKDAITVNWWGYMDNWTSYGRAISCTEGGGWNFEPSGGKMNFACGTGASSNTYKSVVSTTTLASLSAGWHMFTGTYDGFKTKIYIDGKLENTNNAYSTKTPLYYANNSIFLGIEAQGGVNNPTSPYFNGRLSDVRIYATALSDAAIQELYTIRWSANKQGQVFSGTINENQSKFQIARGGVNNCNQVYESGVVPNGYLALDGIKMERVPWINTGVVFNNANTQIMVAADVTPTATSGNNCLAGCGNSSWTGPVMFNFCGGKLEFGTNGYSTSSEVQGAYAANERLVVHAVIDYNSQKWFKNGVQIKNITSRTCPTTTAPLYIGTFKTPSSSVGNSNSFRGFIHYFEVKYGSIHKKFIPCKRLADSVLGMYEINEGIFYSPEGGTYTAGPQAVSQSRDGSLHCAEFNEN